MYDHRRFDKICVDALLPKRNTHKSIVSAHQASCYFSFLQVQNVQTRQPLGTFGASAIQLVHQVVPPGILPLLDVDVIARRQDGFDVTPCEDVLPWRRAVPPPPPLTSLPAVRPPLRGQMPLPPTTSRRTSTGFLAGKNTQFDLFGQNIARIKIAL